MPKKKADQLLKIKASSSRFEASFSGVKPIAVAFVSDQHIGGTSDLRRMREDAQLIANTTGLYAILGGDGLDNHIKHFGAIIAAKHTPDDQYKLFEHYLGLLGDKVLVAISGNHEAWTMAASGIDLLARIVKNKKIAYSANEARLQLKLGDIVYSLAVRHQYRYNSSFNQTHAVKQWLRMGEEMFDVGVICHHHEASMEHFFSHGLDRIAIRPGTYQRQSDFSARLGFNAGKPSCPTVILFPKERKILPFVDVRPAAAVLRALRGGQ
jgi:predicted MPP superfamily phosphohydrolase